MQNNSAEAKELAHGNTTGVESAVVFLGAAYRSLLGEPSLRIYREEVGELLLDLTAIIDADADSDD